MTLNHAEQVARAVLYEGYVLYPYRAGAIKNRQRWTFGGLFPPNYVSAGHADEASRLQTQFLVQGDAAATLTLRLRFLQAVDRQAGCIQPPIRWRSAQYEPDWQACEVVNVDERRYYSWQEAVEREVAIDERLGELLAGPRQHTFGFDPWRSVEPLRNSAGRVPALLVRTGMALCGDVWLHAEPLDDGLLRVTVKVTNRSAPPNPAVLPRQLAQLYALGSTHLIAGVSDGCFVSLLDPPPALRAAAAACQNLGAWPVLAGDRGRNDRLLVSPIILYDHPRVAAHSPGDLYDSTEIDELLSLRIRTLSDSEKAEMAALDEHTRALLQRTESLTPQQWQAMHGTLQAAANDQPGTGEIGLHVGQRVRIRPRQVGGDAMDLLLRDRLARVESIECDFEDRLHVAVLVEDDPGVQWGVERMPGHRFFFRPDELEPCDEPESSG